MMCQVYLVWAQIQKLNRLKEPHAVETYISVFSGSTDSEVERYGQPHAPSTLILAFFICECQLYLMWAQIRSWRDLNGHMLRKHTYIAS